MKFAQNRMYIESYNKCPNCGLLLYEEPASGDTARVSHDNKTYCSQWCVDFEADRATRRQRGVAPAAVQPLR